MPLQARKRGKKKQTKTEKLTAAAFREVNRNEPSTVARANVSEKRKKKMRTAIALNKARKRGARIPKKG